MASGGSNVNSMTWLPEKLLRSEAFPTDDVSRGRCLPNVRSAVPAKNGRGFFGSCRIPSVDAELRDGPSCGVFRDDSGVAGGRGGGGLGASLWAFHAVVPAASLPLPGWRSIAMRVSSNLRETRFVAGCLALEAGAPSPCTTTPGPWFPLGSLLFLVVFGAVLDFPAHHHHLSVVTLLGAASLSPACLPF